MVAEAVRNARKRLAGIRDNDDRHIRGVRQIDLTLRNKHLRAAIDGILGIRMPVRLQSHDAEECIPGLHVLAVEGDAGYPFVLVTDDGAGYSREELRTGFSLSHGHPRCGLTLYLLIANDIISLKIPVVTESAGTLVTPTKHTKSESELGR